VIRKKNVTSLALEVPYKCLVAGSDPVIGAWTTASVPKNNVMTQVSRLGSPLVNEVVIGLPDKDKFNASEPKDDLANFGTYVQYPTLPVLVNVLFGVAPPATPRSDLVAAFVTGITANVNGTPFKYTAPANLTVPGEMLRLNTAIAPVKFSLQKDLGFLDCDLAGFPNGRRPVDDVVDIELTVAEGALTGTNGLQTCDVSGPTPVVVNPGAVVNDGAQPNINNFLKRFPYLNTPLAGSP
jgi:hypothetical protein